uniref:Uncharacterized protein n=1 Tax=Timema poppense TaxID=170557 RepID=A0A7R9CHB9_TIMPO|nr:unnamed protein product [Timema poppensis]
MVLSWVNGLIQVEPVCTMLDSTGKILETLSLKHLPNAQIHVDPSYLPPISPSQIATRPCTPLSPLQKSSSGPVTAHMLAVAHGTNPQFLNQHGDHQSAVMYESIRHKMTDSMAKLAGLSSSPIMGNPRVLLPQNMATILTLAALQEQRQSGGKGAASPSHDPNKTPALAQWFGLVGSLAPLGMGSKRAGNEANMCIGLQEAWSLFSKCPEEC